MKSEKMEIREDGGLILQLIKDLFGAISQLEAQGAEEN